MTFSTTITSSFSAHTFFVRQVTLEDLLDMLPEAQHATLRHYTTFYVVKNWDANGAPMLYLAKGDPRAPKQIVAWYRGGSFWASFGETLKGAIEGAQRDGWLHA